MAGADPRLMLRVSRRLREKGVNRILRTRPPCSDPSRPPSPDATVRPAARARQRAGTANRRSAAGSFGLWPQRAYW